MNDSPPIPLEPSASPRLGKVVVFLILGIVLIAGGRYGFVFARLHLALSNAHREYSNKQFMRATFWADRALSTDQNNVEAIRLMAEINETQDKSESLGWRIKVARMNPGNTGDIMALAKCALRFGESDVAISALNNLPADFKNHNAEYHELMAGCALANREFRLAEAHFVKAAELDPGNPMHRVSIAAFRLENSTSPEIRATAIHELKNMLSDPRVTLFAVRALLFDAVRSRDSARTQILAEKLRSIPEHNFTDDLSCLEGLMPVPAFRPALQAIEQRAESNTAWITSTGEWLNSRGMAGETLHWFPLLPEAARSNVHVQITEAEAHLALSDWNGLQTFLEKCHWDNGEYIRRAMLVRCERELSQPWEKEWKQLVTEVELNPRNGLLLAQLIYGWNWRNETLDLLWGAATKPMTQSRALDYLWDLYSRTNETGKLWRVARAQLDIDPTNPAIKNNNAFLSLLLYGASEHAERLAREASTANPKTPERAATYAYALHLSGKESEAKKVMRNLPPEALGRPGIALYYAIVLAANGDVASARETLVKLNTHGMLPEEQTLAADLSQRLNASSH